METAFTMVESDMSMEDVELTDADIDNDTGLTDVNEVGLLNIFSFAPRCKTDSQRSTHLSPSSAFPFAIRSAAAAL